MSDSRDVPDAGSSTDQHVGSSGDGGPFTTDEPPRADTPVHGSSNAGFNTAGAHGPGSTTEPDEPDTR